MKYKIYLILILILPLHNLYSQSNDIEIYNEMFKWNFSIPNYFENVSPSEAEKNQASGKEIIENPSKTDAYNAEMRKGGETIVDPKTGDTIHNVGETK